MSLQRSWTRLVPGGIDDRPAREPDQRRLRPDTPVRNLAEFLAFLEEFEAVAGRIDRFAKPIEGTAFRL